MGTINWSNFTGETFQSFCNVLLSFEVSKQYIPYDAPGADGGIDGWYDGEFNGNKGKWRFQAKFHSPETGRMSGVNQLKQQVKKDLDKNVASEDHVIFITNVDVNPNQRKEILGIASEVIKQKKYDISFDLWDGAKIKTIISNYPLVYLWYFNNFKYMIQDYQEFFEEQLDSNQNTFYTLSNKFYFREESLNKLEKFINHSSKTTALVSGDAGLGKTRLCVEFFKNYIDPRDDWKGLVLVTHSIDFEEVRRALTGKKNYVVLLDDAHNFEAKDIADLIEIINSIKSNKVKLLLTVRSYFKQEVLEKLRPALKAKITSIAPKNLTREETTSILTQELKGYRISEHINYLVNMTHGKPIMIVTLLKMIHDGLPLSSISDSSNLNDFIENHFRLFSETLSNQTDIARGEIYNIIQVLTLIEPIDVNDTGILELISSNENIAIEKLVTIFNSLLEKRLIVGSRSFAIKPDYYSDFILKKAITNNAWINKKLPVYARFLNNIIKNLGSIESDKVDILLDPILDEFVNQIESCDSTYKLADLLETIYFITYPKPFVASKAVDKVISIYLNTNHPLHKTVQNEKVNNAFTSSSYYNYLKKIIRNLFQLKDYYIKSFDQSSRLFDILESEPIVSNLARFGRSDHFDGFNCLAQNRILELCRGRLLDPKRNDLFSIRALKNLLELEFTDTESHINSKNQVQICTYYPPENQHVKKLRKEIIELLIEYFHIDNVRYKTESLYLLLNVPRGIYAVRNKAYKGTSEIKMVLEFLQSIPINKLDISEKQEIKNQLYLYEKWGLKGKSNLAIVEKIKQSLSKKDLTEQIYELFNPTYEDRLLDKERFKEESIEIIESRTADEIGKGVVEVIAKSKYLPHNLYPFLNRLSENIEKSKGFIDFLWDYNRKFVVEHCAFILQTLRFQHKKDEYYWKYVELILEEDNIESKNCVLTMYRSLQISNFYNKSNNVLTKKDQDLIIGIFRNSTMENYFHLAMALPSLLFIDKDVGIAEIEKFLVKCQERHVDNLFLGLDPFEGKLDNEIKNLVLTSTIHLNVQYHTEQLLNKIILKDGIKDVLGYFEKRLLFKREKIKTEQTILGYDFAPHNSSHTILNGVTTEQRTEIFKQVLEWFIEFDFEPLETFYSKDIISLFKTNKFIDESTLSIYDQILDKYSSDYSRMLNLIKSISVFEKKNKEILELIVKILDRSYYIFNEEEFKKIQSECYISLTNTGVKMGTPGEPFSVDLEMNELLENAINEGGLKPEARNFLVQVKKTVQSDIDSAKREEDEEEW